MTAPSSKSSLNPAWCRIGAGDLASRLHSGGWNNNPNSPSMAVVHSLLAVAALLMQAPRMLTQLGWGWGYARSILFHLVALI